MPKIFYNGMLHCHERILELYEVSKEQKINMLKTNTEDNKIKMLLTWENNISPTMKTNDVSHSA